MGWRERKWAKGPDAMTRMERAIEDENYEEAARLRDLKAKGVDIDAPGADVHDGDVPTWGQITDVLRSRFIECAEAATISGPQDMLALIEGLRVLFMVHVNGLEQDKGRAARGRGLTRET